MYTIIRCIYKCILYVNSAYMCYTTPPHGRVPYIPTCNMYIGAIHTFTTCHAYYVYDALWLTILTDHVHLLWRSILHVAITLRCLLIVMYWYGEFMLCGNTKSWCMVRTWVRCLWKCDGLHHATGVYLQDWRQFCDQQSQGWPAQAISSHNTDTPLSGTSLQCPPLTSLEQPIDVRELSFTE